MRKPRFDFSSVQSARHRSQGDTVCKYSCIVMVQDLGRKVTPVHSYPPVV